MSTSWYPPGWSKHLGHLCGEARSRTPTVIPPRLVTVAEVRFELLKFSCSSRSMSNLLAQGKQPAHPTKTTPCPMLRKMPVCHRQVVDPTTVVKPSLRDNPSASIFAPMRTRPFPAPHCTNERFVVLTRANAQHAIKPFLLGMTKGFGQVPIRNVNERGGCSKCAVPTLPLPNVYQAIHYILHLVLPIRKYEDVICKTQIQQTTHTVSKTYTQM